MAISIVENLHAQQEQVRLPIRLHLFQVLSSNRDSEQVQIEYSLDEGHNVWFEGPTKTVSRTEKIGNAETPIEHRLKLVRGDGAEVERPTIHQAIINPQGIRKTDRTAVTVLRGAAQ